MIPAQEGSFLDDNPFWKGMLEVELVRNCFIDKLFRFDISN